MALALLPGGSEWILLVVLALLLFGATKIPDLARSLGKAKAEFKRGEQEGLSQLERERDEEEVRRKARALGIETEGKTLDELRREVARRS